MRLRIQGFSFREIALRLGYNSPQASFDAVKRALEKTLREPANELRSLESERLDEMFQRAYLMALSGDLQAMQTAMKVMERRAKLLGLDAPVKTELTGADGTPLAPPSFNVSFGDGGPGQQVASPSPATQTDAP